MSDFTLLFFFIPLFCETNDKLVSVSCVCLCVVVFTIVHRHHHIIISVQKPAPSLSDIIALRGHGMCAHRKCNCGPSLCSVCIAISLLRSLFEAFFVYRNASQHHFLSTTKYLGIESTFFASNISNAMQTVLLWLKFNS